MAGEFVRFVGHLDCPVCGARPVDDWFGGDDEPPTSWDWTVLRLDCDECGSLARATVRIVEMMGLL